ncbi:MAG: DeoR/GlpR transcriptional regulator [Firmicutes bacterium]|nr:DeoR/GlpR transcriptional regulator [Bacillota bacterium]
MLQWEREQQILQYLEQKQTSSVKELAKYLYVSEASVRRDLEKMEKAGIVERVYGGVLLSKYRNGIKPAQMRDKDYTDRKELIAEKASKKVSDGDTILMDASTTVFRMCRYLKKKKNLKVITNSPRICTELADCAEITVFCTGGTYTAKNHCFLGSYAEQFLEKVNADAVFFSAQGIDPYGRISDVSEEEISMDQAMMYHARKKYFLCDSSKFGVVRPFTLCTKEDVDEILCDIELEFLPL